MTATPFKLDLETEFKWKPQNFLLAQLDIKFGFDFALKFTLPAILLSRNIV